MAYTVKTDQEKLFELAWQMDQAGNTGWYRGTGLIHLYKGGRYAGKTCYLEPTQFAPEMRAGIFYYTSGCGWRVRKNPHWFTVFCERFPETVKMWREGNA